MCIITGKVHQFISHCLIPLGSLYDIKNWNTFLIISVHLIFFYKTRITWTINILLVMINVGLNVYVNNKLPLITRKSLVCQLLQPFNNSTKTIKIVKSSIKMDLFLLGSYTRLSCTLIKWNLKLAKITMFNLHFLYPILSSPTGWTDQ